MAIGSVRGSRSSIQDEILNSRKKAEGSKGSNISEAKRSRSHEGVNHGHRNHSKDPPSTPPPTSQPPPATTPSPPQADNRSLAERYVSQYETQSGRTLSDAERAQKIDEVENFYNDAERNGRLEKIVFA